MYDIGLIDERTRYFSRPEPLEVYKRIERSTEEVFLTTDQLLNGDLPDYLISLNNKRVNSLSQAIRCLVLPCQTLNLPAYTLLTDDQLYLVKAIFLSLMMGATPISIKNDVKDVYPVVFGALI